MSQIHYFLATVAITIAITFWAARRNTGRASFYAAEGKISATQNGLAIAGDFLSAGTVLGIVGLFFAVGMDAAPYLITPLAGLFLMLTLIVGPLRRLGRYTLGDVITHRLGAPRMRMVIGLCTIVISLINLVAQLVGAGALISIVFGLPFNLAVVIVAALMTGYVAFGGMLAATWVQIIKAVILIAMIAVLAGLCIWKAGGYGALFDMAEASAGSRKMLEFGGLKLGLFGAISLALTQMAGMMGMPHLLIRFFTVPDERAARQSLVLGATIIGIAMGTVLLVVGPAAIAFVGGDPSLRDSAGGIIGGTNMITMHLSRLMGGDLLFGLMSAVAFSTILAVVAGLTISISSATSHDLVLGLRRGPPLSERSEVALFRTAAIATSILGTLLAILFQKENITFLIVMGQTVAASTTFPLLILAIYWRGLTASGAVAAGLFGLVTSVAGIVAGPAFWVKALGHAAPLLPTDYPALVTVPATFVVAWVVSSIGRPSLLQPA
ncbi:cation acetate symporter [Sphingobium aromaticiconvertens]|uniref:solute symporter family protein n=1 Tax=Sphingobium aromaticiconvertens TaxID=365341 RepID=UPI00301A1190